MRKLASIRRIDAINPIPNADAIDVATIGGWNVVVKKGEFQVNDLVVYCEVDSWIPHELAPFLSKGNEPRTYEGVKGERLKTVKLRGQLSQGLILPISTTFGNTDEFEFYEDMDVTETLGILKYEKPVSVSLAGFARGNFPSFIPKTDQERCIVGDSIVLTKDGPITIQKIVEDKMQVDVLSMNHNTNVLEYKPILNWSCTRKTKESWVKITTESGKHLICTPDHMIWVNELNAYRMAGDLSIGQEIIAKTD